MFPRPAPKQPPMSILSPTFTPEMPDSSAIAKEASFAPQERFHSIVNREEALQSQSWTGHRCPRLSSPLVVS
ncbi:hypothetical protein HJFPF1_08918 [Paramyrothecium foliicola]|nr:hypothetical protein HJFPF1_08918 [Paramyrothecium foliicola]